MQGGKLSIVLVPSQDFHTRVEKPLKGDDLAQHLFKVFKAGHEEEDRQGAARAAKSAVCKLEIKAGLLSSPSVWAHCFSLAGAQAAL